VNRSLVFFEIIFGSKKNFLVSNEAAIYYVDVSNEYESGLNGIGFGLGFKYWSQEWNTLRFFLGRFEICFVFIYE
jgi:hypothetical protein